MNLLYSGKVRDIYDAGDDRLLLVASDRISAFDVVLDQPIPHKGRVLTLLTQFWVEQMTDIVPNHLISVDGSSMLVHKAEMLPIECIVRGYLSGSAWKEYKQSGTMHGATLPEGMQESEQLPEPLYTPSTKAEVGHDEAIDFEQTVELLGDRALAERLREVSLAVYEKVAEYARERGVILADTKFEFGLDPEGNLVLGDEVCTPDSSRFWPVEGYAPGKGQPSFDKQYVRDWASSTGWDKSPPAPEIPEDIAAGTRARYVEAYELLTGQSF